MMDLDSRDYSCPNPYNIDWKARLLGYSVQTSIDKKTGEPKYVSSMKNFHLELYKAQLKEGLLVPRIIIDKPYFENAAELLRVMGGYVVEKLTRKKRKLYCVTLL